MISLFIIAINWFARILIMLLFGRAILSWFATDPYSTAGKLYSMCVALTEPIVSPIRIFLSRYNTGMFDFSVLLAMLLVELVERVLIRILWIFMI